MAALYGVATRVLLQAVRRNLERFPPDFMFELSATEWTALRSQFVTSTPRRGGRRYAPYAFTEQGVAMLSSVLNSDRGIAVNIEIMRSFVRIRKLLEADKSLARKFERLERRLASHDQAIVGSGSHARGKGFSRWQIVLEQPALRSPSSSAVTTGHLDDRRSQDSDHGSGACPRSCWAS